MTKLYSLFYVVLFLGLQTAGAQSRPILGCIDELNIPTYPPIAHRSSRIGDVTVEISKNKSGQMEWKIVESTSTMFLPVVELYLRKSSFRKSCLDNTFTLNFSFRISEWTDSTRRSRSRVTLKSPNTIVITSNPPSFD
jgi:hypothetical protein